MFNALESHWDQSARRGWTTLASFTLQALGLSLLLLIPILAIQGPPMLQWLDPSVTLPPPASAPPPGPQHPIHSSNLNQGILQTPQSVPQTIARLDETQIASAPDFDSVGVEGGTNVARHGVPDSLGPSTAVAPPPPPGPTHPIKVSQWAEGNIIYRLQPTYPALARAARVQGTVELRAIISKTGTIEKLLVVRGHPMLSAAALEAVKQWRYRPYLLNNEPVEVETEITVNFVLSGS